MAASEVPVKKVRQLLSLDQEVQVLVPLTGEYETLKSYEFQLGHRAINGTVSPGFYTIVTDSHWFNVDEFDTISVQ